MELLDERQILDGLPRAVRGELASLTVLARVDSTNRFLMEGEAFDGPRVHACVAETQTAGRGRRGRVWISPQGANLYLSVLRSFTTAPETLLGLSLAVGVAVARAMTSAGVNGVALKWPNDILLGGKKLGGILLETSGGSAGPSRVVCGIGVNVDMPGDAGAAIDQAWTDLASHGINPGRNRLAACVLAEVIAAQTRFIEAGFEVFRHEWEALDAFRNAQVELHAGTSRRRGTARGVDDTGALLLEIDGRCERVMSGDVSLRVAT